MHLRDTWYNLCHISCSNRHPLLRMVLRVIKKIAHKYDSQRRISRLLCYENMMTQQRMIWCITRLYDTLQKYMIYYTITRHVTESHDILQNDMIYYTIIWHVAELYDILHNYKTCYRITWRITEWYDVLHDYVTHYRIIWYITQLQDMLQNCTTIAI